MFFVLTSGECAHQFQKLHPRPNSFQLPTIHFQGKNSLISGRVYNYSPKMMILMLVCPAQEQPAPQGTSVPKEKVFKSAAWLMGMMMAHG